MGHPDGHDAPERIDSPYPRKLPDDQPDIRWRQLTWAVSCIIWYPIASVLLVSFDVGVAVAVALVSPFVISYYSAGSFRSWSRRILTLLAVLCICWLVSDSLLRVIEQAR